MPSGPAYLHTFWSHFSHDKSEQEAIELGGDQNAIRYLQSQGYTLTPKWEWTKPRPEYEPQHLENLAINYLIEEWDFGGLARV